MGHNQAGTGTIRFASTSTPFCRDARTHTPQSEVSRLLVRSGEGMIAIVTKTAKNMPQRLLKYILVMFIPRFHCSTFWMGCFHVHVIRISVSKCLISSEQWLTFKKFGEPKISSAESLAFRQEFNNLIILWNEMLIHLDLEYYASTLTHSHKVYIWFL